MKKILFIENRYHTIFWNDIADLLAKDGYEIFYIVENHIFAPDRKNVYKIPYPAKRDLKKSAILTEFDSIRRSDRAVNHFGLTSTDHYSYYYKQIEAIIDKVLPDIVFGESTAFHELLTIEICKKKKILYLNPTSCRYPAGRFSFYKYDTLEPYSGSGEELPDAAAMQIIKEIVYRKVVPDYMKKKKVKIKDRYARFKELGQLTFSYYGKEHYNTPSPFVKYKLEKQRKKNIIRWNIFAGTQRGKIDIPAFKILYPLQMQPEANLDVWGRKYNNQLQIIKKIIRETEDDTYLIIKPNPKSKYELSSDLIDYVQETKRIIPVHHDVMMGEILPEADMVVTVTGTVAMECVWSNKPVVTLLKTIHNSAGNAVFLENLDNLRLYADMVREKKFPIITDKQKIEFINLITRTSFIGMPYEGITDDENMKLCKTAFEKILHEL